jgi:sugar O-acyltransferase (sialic acid O-acetyltransferase NeuD family)
MSIPVIVLGAGGHAKVLIEALLKNGAVIAGIVDPNPVFLGTEILGVPVIGGDEVITGYPPTDVLLVNGIGSISRPEVRKSVFERFVSQGYRFATVVHSSAVVASDVMLGEGAQVMAGAVIQPGTRIGCNAIVNTRASVDHDCQVEDHGHLAPGVTLSGNVAVGAGTHVGTGATVIQGVSIGANCLVAAGALVIRAVQDNMTVMGVPAREVQR